MGRSWLSCVLMNYIDLQFVFSIQVLFLLLLYVILFIFSFTQLCLCFFFMSDILKQLITPLPQKCACIHFLKKYLIVFRGPNMFKIRNIYLTDIWPLNDNNNNNDKKIFKRQRTSKKLQKNNTGPRGNSFCARTLLRTDLLLSFSLEETNLVSKEINKLQNFCTIGRLFHKERSISWRR